MKRLAFKCALLLFLICVCDYFVGKALRQMFFANQSGAPGYVLNHLANAKYDAYVMGSSGAQRGYIPSVLQKELGLSVFNTGEAGTSMLYTYAALQIVLKHHTPKLIIWDITNGDYYYRSDSGKTAMITPFHNNKEIKELLLDIDPFNRLWLLSGIYPNNQKMFGIIGSFIHKPKPGVAGDNGYHAIYDVLDPDKVKHDLLEYEQEERSLLQRSAKQQKLDRLLRKYFHAFIALCRDNNIKLVAFTCPKAPLTEALEEKPSLTEELRAQLKKYKIPLYCILPGTHPEMNDLSLYYDIHHLNDNGAKAYSAIVAGYLK